MLKLKGKVNALNLSFEGKKKGKDCINSLSVISSHKIKGKIEKVFRKGVCIARNKRK